MGLLTFYKSKFSLIFFRLEGFVLRCFRLCYCLVNFLPMLNSHSIALPIDVSQVVQSSASPQYLNFCCHLILTLF